MKLRVLVSLVAVLTFFGISAHAQDLQKVDVFAGYSYVRVNPGQGANGDDFPMNGASASIAYNFDRYLSAVADFGGYTTNFAPGTGPANGNTASYTYMVGPRVSFRRYHRVTPFAQVLFGGVHTGFDLVSPYGSANAFAMSVGAGIDINLTHHWAIRPVQVDYLLTRVDSYSQNNSRWSSGIVYRF